MRFLRSHRFLLLIPLLTDAAGSLVIFAVGRDMAETGAGMARMGAVGAVFPAGLGATSLMSGWLSDRLGRRSMILAGLTVLMAGLYAAMHYYYFLAYALGGIGLGLVYPPCVAWLTQGRSASGPRSAMSRMLILFCLSWNLGLMSGQILGGWLFTVDRSWPILTSGAFAAMAMIVAMVCRTPQGPARVADQIAVEVDAAHRAGAASFARLARVANLGGAFSMSAIFHLFPKTAVDVGIASDDQGILLGMTRVVIVLVYFFLHLTSFWHFRFSAALTSQAVAVVGLLLLTVTDNFWLIALALAAAGQVQGYNYFAGLYYSTAGSSDEQRGASSGLHEGTISLGMAAGSLVGGLVGAHWHPRAPYFVAATVIAALMVMQFVASRKMNARARGPA